MGDLKGQVAVVTGSAIGIGAEIAAELARQGAVVAITDINPDSAEKTISDIKKNGGLASAFFHDVRDPKSSISVVEAVEASLGPISILVNNAGVSKRVPVLEMDEAEWDRVMDINLKGTFFMIKATLPFMIERSYGRVINLSSVVGKKGYPDFSHYCASKFGVLGLSQSLAAEVAKCGVTVNSVCPGIVMTPLHDKIVEEMAEAEGIPFEVALKNFLSNVPQGRAQSPLDVARMVAFLAAKDAGAMTGGSYHVDGGMVMS